MHSDDLLAREKEFKKLNQQLEKKTESLMKEIDCAMQNKDSFAEFYNNLTPSKKMKAPKLAKVSPRTQPKNNQEETDAIPNAPITNIPISNAPNANVPISNPPMVNARPATESRQLEVMMASDRDEQNKELEYFYAFASVCVEDGILPVSFLKGKVTIQRVCKFLSEKIKLLQEQKDKLMGVIEKRGKQCEAHMNGLAKLEEERLSLLNKVNSCKAEVADVKAKYGVMQSKLNEKDDLYKEERRNSDKLANELKQVKSKTVNLEARCASQEQVINNLKHQLEAAKLAEKEYKASSRMLSESRLAAISQLEHRLGTLSAAIDKQDMLIDNLRAQNSILVNKHALVALESEYNNFFKDD